MTFLVRAFYLQVIRHHYYRQAAMQHQLKEYEVPAERGVLRAHDGTGTTPLVLNEKKYTVFADPTYVDDAAKEAAQLAPIIGRPADELTALLRTPKTRYVVLAKKLSKEQAVAIDNMNLLGIGTREYLYRTYPQGRLAAHVLGFVNDEGEGQYGIEQAMNGRLSGTPGRLSAITDARGVPLVANSGNVVIDPRPGQDLLLTLDIGLQRHIEDLLKTGLDRAKSKSGSVIVMDPNNGEIKAMANWPAYEPASFQSVDDISLFSNRAIASPLEVGSIMKTLTAAAALDTGAVTLNSQFFNEGHAMVGDRKITDVVASRGTQSIESVLVNSLNTGAVWLYRQMGNGNYTEAGRKRWHDYMANRFLLGNPTGIELAGETGGLIPPPEDTGMGIDVTYANTSFGQGMTATMLQMAAALSSVLNGGNYYAPRIVDAAASADGSGVMTDVKPVLKRSGVVSAEVSAQMVTLMERVASSNIPGITRSGYIIGGKTGTAQIARPEGGYYTDKYHGTYLGFVGGDRPEYVIAVRVDEPGIAGFAGSAAAAPIFKDVTAMLIDNYGVTPKRQ